MAEVKDSGLEKSTEPEQIGAGEENQTKEKPQPKSENTKNSNSVKQSGDNSNLSPKHNGGVLAPSPVLLPGPPKPVVLQNPMTITPTPADMLFNHGYNNDSRYHHAAPSQIHDNRNINSMNGMNNMNSMNNNMNNLSMNSNNLNSMGHVSNQIGGNNQMGINNQMGGINQMGMNGHVGMHMNSQMNTSIGNPMNTGMNSQMNQNHHPANQNHHQSHHHQNSNQNQNLHSNNQNPQMHMIFSRGMPDDDGQDFYEEERKAFFLGGLHRDMQREDIYNELQKYGLYIRKLDCPYNDKNTKSGNKGYAFVHVKDETMAQKILTLEKLKILNETCSVKPYKRDPNNRKRSGNQGPENNQGGMQQRDSGNNRQQNSGQMNQPGQNKFQGQSSGGKSGGFDQRTMDFSFLQNQNYQQNPQLMAMFWQNQFQELYKAHVMLLQNQFMSNPNNGGNNNSSNNNNNGNGNQNPQVPHLPAFPPYTPNFTDDGHVTQGSSGTPWNPKVQDFVPGHRTSFQNHHYQNHGGHQQYNPPVQASRATNITPVMQDFQNDLMNSLFANDKGYDVPTSMGPIGKKTSKIPLAKDPLLSNDDGSNGLGFDTLDSYKSQKTSKTNGSTVASSTVESSTVVKDDEHSQESINSNNGQTIASNNNKVEEQNSAVSGSLATSPDARTDRGRTESNSRIVQEIESDGNVKRSGSGNINGNRVKSISSSSTGQAPMYKKQSSIFDDKNTLSASDEQQRRYFSTSRTTSDSSDQNNNTISKQ